jgi:hypothetical protein
MPQFCSAARRMAADDIKDSLTQADADSRSLRTLGITVRYGIAPTTIDGAAISSGLCRFLPSSAANW